jgi:hypothetical protein
MFRFFFALLFSFTAFARVDEYEQPPIRYSDTAPKDAITRLQARLDARETTYSGSERDVLQALLRDLGIPVSSQMLVFSKTSVQRVRISPRNPRAIYFNDEVYLGWVPGGLIEVAAMDAHLGPVFYTFDPLERGSEPQRFRRDPSCLSCHAGGFTRDIPGVFARSVFAESTGSPIFSAGSQVVDYTTPFHQRWGGWYVTGKHGTGRHRGNAFAREEGHDVLLDTESGANIDDLRRFFDPSLFPVATSDLGALLVFEHQLAMHQALTRGSYDARRMLAYQRGLQESFGEPITNEPSYDSVKRVFANAAESILDGLLFRDEAPLPDGGISGSEGFIADYQAAGPHTADGRSLRQLDFRTRIAKYRCSPLIYGEHFRSLPEPLLQQVLARMEGVLFGNESDSRYDYLNSDERRAIAEILMETAPDLTTGWKRGSR